MKKLLITAGITLGLVLAVSAYAATTSALFGGAYLNENGVVLVSNVSNNPGVTDDDYSGVDFDVHMLFDDLVYLATDYNVTDDDCGGGSPRFQLNVDTTGDGNSNGNVFVYIGPSPSYVDCAPDWQSTGNLVINPSPIFDTSQLGGSFYNTHAQALALLTGHNIVGVQLVSDSGWHAGAASGDGEQTVWVNNVIINEESFAFAPPTRLSQCLREGWQNFNGNAFRNQGNCMSYVVHQIVQDKLDRAHDRLPF
ncbi:MAG: hypothetical protein Q8P83_01155 [bacterium]|nr:hypothetical protein [bacterium]